MKKRVSNSGQVLQPVLVPAQVPSQAVLAPTSEQQQAPVIDPPVREPVAGQATRYNI
jgi:hypothetical protein